MRVNHAGEICAQGLYQGQALTAKQDTVRQHMEQAAREEIDHLAWCEQRLEELGAKPSRLNPVWLAGSTVIGAISGIIGDAWSLGFLAETEQQVGAHLENHRARLAPHDQKTRHLLESIQADESMHAEQARSAGARSLPPLLRFLMRCSAKIMTTVAYRV